jgi:type II secretory pathway pseudopilin PulG
MALTELIIVFLLISIFILGVVSTYLYVRQLQLASNVERLTKSLTAQIIASGSLNQNNPPYVAPPEQPIKNSLVS